MKPKALVLISGGIDSPVAAHMMKEKMDVTPLHFDNFPYAGMGSLDRVESLVEQLGFKEFIVVKHGKNLEEFMKNCDHKFMCVFCRRMMLRMAEEVAKKHKADFLITGESLAQVASQTLENLYVEYQAVDIPIVRPLIGFDKNEIIKIAKEIGTYDLSTVPVICCSAVPSKPSTQARLERILDEESKINTDELVKNAVQTANIVRV